ncbi:hypothetical protein [Mycobacterium colombiense]|uniref:hypothetical protein n=1 Tax=Mycobacterium colombiense TaxID=339268 RepID=UPI00096C3BCD|nr:hypothetical protein A5738_16305 [Mycobacterium colombiense]
MLPFVCHPLAVIRYPLTLGEGLFALVERMSPPFQLRGRLDTSLGGHSSLSVLPFDPAGAAYRRQFRAISGV